MVGKRFVQLKTEGKSASLGRRVCKSWGTVHIILDFEKSAGR